ncbi:MAG TPA: hypothetical protein V6D08_05935 [Candidatus Obscuribacterales bacterium]
MHSETSDILTVVAAAIFEVAQALSKDAGAHESAASTLRGADTCANGICPVVWKPRRPAAA